MSGKKIDEKYKVRVLDPSEADRWDDFIDQSSNGTLFHKYGWMKAAEAQSKTRFYPLVCEKDGEGLISVFPGFVSKELFLNLFFSPPPGCAIPELGPVFSLRSTKQHRIEADLYNTIAGFDAFIRNEYRPDYVNILTNIKDVRSYKWLDYSLEPGYTYRLPLNGDSAEIYQSFNANIRNKIKKIESSSTVDIKGAGAESIEHLLSELQSRYNELQRSFKLKEKYLHTLMSYFGGEQLKLYQCFVDGYPQTSFLTIEYKDNVKFWLGGVHNRTITNGIIETIHWNNIVDALERGFSYYERIGANTKHLCESKSRYGFRPEVYYKVEKWTSLGRVFHSAYENFFRKKSSRE